MLYADSSLTAAVSRGRPRLCAESCDSSPWSVADDAWKKGKTLRTVAPPAGLEPATRGLGHRCSIHLSYEGNNDTGRVHLSIPRRSVRLRCCRRVVLGTTERPSGRCYLAASALHENRRARDGDPARNRAAWSVPRQNRTRRAYAVHAAMRPP